MTAKLSLGAAITILCAMTGRAFAGADARRAKLLAELMDALQMLRIHMLDRLMPLDSALTASRCRLLSETGEVIVKTGAQGAWADVKKREMRRGGLLDCMNANDIQVLDNLFNALGTTGRSEQRPVIDATIRELGNLEAAARNNSGEKVRLYTILGALAGVAAVIFIV